MLETLWWLGKTKPLFLLLVCGQWVILLALMEVWRALTWLCLDQTWLCWHFPMKPKLLTHVISLILLGACLRQGCSLGKRVPTGTRLFIPLEITYFLLLFLLFTYPGQPFWDLLSLPKRRLSPWRRPPRCLVCGPRGWLTGWPAPGSCWCHVLIVFRRMDSRWTK